MRTEMPRCTSSSARRRLMWYSGESTVGFESEVKTEIRMLIQAPLVWRGQPVAWSCSRVHHGTRCATMLILYLLELFCYRVVQRWRDIAEPTQDCGGSLLLPIVRKLGRREVALYALEIETAECECSVIIEK